MLSFWLIGVLLVSAATAQNTIWYQGFENPSASCSENWGYTGGVRNNETARTGSWSGMVGRSGTSHTMTFDDVDVSGLADLNLQIFHSVRCGAGPGMDSREGAVISVRLNGLAWQVLARIGGYGDQCYSWTAAQGGSADPMACDIYQSPNPLNYIIPAGTNTVGVRIVSVSQGDCSSYNSAMNAGTAGMYNRDDEGFHIDDVRITTSSTDFNSIWTGNVSTDWHDCLNWNNGIVPSATSNVLIDQSGNTANDCTVLNANATCNNLTLTSATSSTQGLVVTDSRSLSVLGNMLVSRTANVSNTLTAAATSGGTIEVSGEVMATVIPLIFFNASILLLAENGGGWDVAGNVFLENNAIFPNPRVGIALNGLVASEFRCLDLSMTGNVTTDMNSCYFLMQSNHNHILEVRGDFLMQNNTQFNMGGYNNPQAQFGGDISNQVSAAQFLIDNSQVVLNGNGVQEISTSGFALPFHDLTFNKTGGHVRLNNDITLSTTGMLSLNNDYLELNANELFINNPAAGAIARINGAIAEESGSGTGINEGRINWDVGSGVGSFSFPFSRGVGGPFIPFVFDRISGNAGTVSVSTYGTPPDNQPWPLFPEPVLNLNSTTGLMPDNQDATVDRFWQIDVSGAPTANLTFNYAPDELPAAPYNLPASLRAQRYDTDTDTWQSAPASQVTGPNSVQVQNVSTFSPWTLASDLSPLPLDWLSFTAIPFPKQVDLEWVTTNQVNTSHFEVQRSSDALQYETIGTSAAAGFASYPIAYAFSDDNPLAGKIYYRIKQVDFDGAYTFSEVRAVNRSTAGNVEVRYGTDGVYISLCSEATSQVFNSVGQEIHNEKSNGSLFIPFGTHPPGIYFLRTGCDNAEEVTRFILN